MYGFSGQCIDRGYRPTGITAHTLSTRFIGPCPRFIGPFEIIRQVNPVAYQLRLSAAYRICPTIHVSLLKPAHPLAGGVTDGGSHHHRWTLRGPQHTGYVLSWTPGGFDRGFSTSWTGRGYSVEERSWVDAIDILDPSLTKDFHCDHPNKPALRPRGRLWHRTPGGVPGGGGSVTTRPGAAREREVSPAF
ncbi:hypothetical protein QTP86_030492 [Hemibagrus guttatus]|nr:hypothetical protein QTP86_030492 [Hemibagrus guttatus]